MAVVAESVCMYGMVKHREKRGTANLDASMSVKLVISFVEY